MSLCLIFGISTVSSLGLANNGDINISNQHRLSIGGSSLIAFSSFRAMRRRPILVVHVPLLGNITGPYPEGRRGEIAMAWCQSIHWPERIFITHLSQPMTLTLKGKFALSLSENTTRAGNGCAYGFISPCTSNSGGDICLHARGTTMGWTSRRQRFDIRHLCQCQKKYCFVDPSFHFKREVVFFIFGGSKVPLPNEKVIFWFFFCFVLCYSLLHMLIKIKWPCDSFFFASNARNGHTHAQQATNQITLRSLKGFVQSRSKTIYLDNNNNNNKKGVW